MKHGYFDNMNDKRIEAWQEFGHDWQDECDDTELDRLIDDMAAGV